MVFAFFVNIFDPNLENDVPFYSQNHPVTWLCYTYTHVEFCEKVRSWPATMLQKGERKQGEEHQEVSL